MLEITKLEVILCNIKGANTAILDYLLSTYRTLKIRVPKISQLHEEGWQQGNSLNYIRGKLLKTLLNDQQVT
jgi:hypothetical protein